MHISESSADTRARSRRGCNNSLVSKPYQQLPSPERFFPEMQTRLTNTGVLIFLARPVWCTEAS